MLCSLVAQPYKQALAAKARVPGVWTRQGLGSLEERFRCNIVLLYEYNILTICTRTTALHS